VVGDQQRLAGRRQAGHLDGERVRVVEAAAHPAEGARAGPDGLVDV